MRNTILCATQFCAQHNFGGHKRNWSVTDPECFPWLHGCNSPFHTNIWHIYLMLVRLTATNTEKINNKRVPGFSPKLLNLYVFVIHSRCSSLPLGIQPQMQVFSTILFNSVAEADSYPTLQVLVIQYNVRNRVLLLIQYLVARNNTMHA